MELPEVPVSAHTHTHTRTHTHRQRERERDRETKSARVSHQKAHYCKHTTQRCQRRQLKSWLLALSRASSDLTYHFSTHVRTYMCLYISAKIQKCYDNITNVAIYIYTEVQTYCMRICAYTRLYNTYVYAYNVHMYVFFTVRHSPLCLLLHI